MEKHKKKVCALLERIKGENAGDCALEMSEGCGFPPWPAPLFPNFEN